MPWVNIFENEDCEVVIGLGLGSNDYPPDPEDVFLLDEDPFTPQYFWNQAGIYSIDEPVIGMPDGSEYAFPWGMYIIPSGGIAGRRFRARMLQQTSGFIDPSPDAGTIQCPGYFVEGCGWMTAYDEAALVPYNPDGNPPADSEWYEFEEVATEPDAGGLENTGWVGLFNYDSEGYSAATRGFYEWQVWVDGPEPDECNYNCSCEDEYPTRTLAQMREFLMIRLGWAAMKDTPLPGVVDTLNAFLQDAQEQLHAEYRLPRLERFFTWDLVEGVRFYDLPENSDVCTKELDPRQLTWVGISDGCDAWRPLVCGIPPQSYYGDISGLPTRYEIRQCIEVWPPPSGDNWKLRIKGYFYNERLEEDEDVASLDYQAVQLFALANAKAHYGQQDAANVMRQAMRYIGNMTAGAHHTRRYVPGTTEWVAPPLPILTGYPGDP